MNYYSCPKLVLIPTFAFLGSDDCFVVNATGNFPPHLLDYIQPQTLQSHQPAGPLSADLGGDTTDNLVQTVLYQ